VISLAFNLLLYISAAAALSSLASYSALYSFAIGHHTFSILLIEKDSDE